MMIFAIALFKICFFLSFSIYWLFTMITIVNSSCFTIMQLFNHTIYHDVDCIIKVHSIFFNFSNKIIMRWCIDTELNFMMFASF